MEESFKEVAVDGKTKRAEGEHKERARGDDGVPILRCC